MPALLSFIGLLLLAGICIFYCVSRIIWPSIIGLILVIYSIYYWLPWWLLLPAWLLFLGCAVFVHSPAALRCRYFTRHIFNKFQQLAPPISETERIALEAGDVWWEGELFNGQPHWQKLLDLPQPQLTSEEQAFLTDQVETLCSMADEWQMQQSAEFPKAILAYIKAQRFWGLIIAKEYGGHGFSAYAHSCVITKIASRSVSAAITIMVPNSLGPAELIQRYGTEAQKTHYLPRLAKGEEIPCFALTAAEAGSDAAHMPDKGVICYGEFQGQSILGIRLNWDKRYITLAPIATVLGLAFRLFDPKHLLGDKEEIGITLCLIPTQHPGVEIGKKHKPMNLAFLNGPTRGRDVFIPIDWVIGGKTQCGKGWHMLMESLAVGRGISLPALATGMSQLALRSAGAYAHLRRQFKVPLGHFEGIQESLARIGGFTYLCEATRILTANAVQLGIKPALASAIAKYHLTELSRKILNDAMDIHGGKTIQFGPHNYLGFFYQALPIGITVEGANILTRNLIIFGQGALRSHEWLKHELKALQQADAAQSLHTFDRLLLKHAGAFSSHLIQLLAASLTGGRLLRVPRTGTKALDFYLRQLTRMSLAFSVVVDVLLLALAGELKRRERLSARLGDIVSYLYLASAIIWNYQHQPQRQNEWPLANWSLNWCLQQISQALVELINNLPKRRWLAPILKMLIFPWGKIYSTGNDPLDQQVAKLIQQPSTLRERLTQYCFIDPKTVGLMEQALKLSDNIIPLQEKLNLAIRNQQINRNLPLAEQLAAAIAVNVLTENEVKLWQQLEQLRSEIIAVDEF